MESNGKVLSRIRFKLTEEEAKVLELAWKTRGARNRSEYLRALIMLDATIANVDTTCMGIPGWLRTAYAIEITIAGAKGQDARRKTTESALTPGLTELDRKFLQDSGINGDAW
jgi:hypothetical protein